MNVNILISFLIRNDIPLDAEIMTDSGWECDATEVDMIYYNSKTNVVVLTRNCQRHNYRDNNDWTLLCKKKKRKKMSGKVYR